MAPDRCRQVLVDAVDRTARDRHVAGRRRPRSGGQDDRLRVDAARVVRVSRPGAQDERAERVTPQHAGVFADVDELAEVPAEPRHDADRQPAELPLRGVHKLQLVRCQPDRLDHRGRRSRGRRTDHGMDDVLGVFDEVEGPPRAVDVPPGDLHQMRREEDAELAEHVAQRSIGGLGHVREQGHRLRIGVGPRWQVGLARRRHGRAEPRLAARAERERLGKFLDVEKDESVHDAPQLAAVSGERHRWLDRL